MPIELPVLTVANSALWRQWLLTQHATSPGIWLTLAKKGTQAPTTLTYQQALEEALCFGFIDGQTRKKDDATYAQRFTPRKAKSAWSQRNVGIIEHLEETGRMQEAGRQAVEAAKADGRWDAAYAGSSTAKIPADFLEAVAKVPTAQTTWDELNKQNRYVIYMRLSSLKTVPGREKRIRAFVEMLARGEAPLPQKRAEKTKAERLQALPDVKSDDKVTRTTKSGRIAPAKFS